jgi:hypothetical protein
MKASLLVYNSGREAPSWILTAEESALFYKQLRVINGTLETWEGDYLGYRGISVQFDENESLRVYKGFIEVTAKSGEVRRFMDINRDFEMWLFQTSRDKIEHYLYDSVLMSEFLS